MTEFIKYTKNFYKYHEEYHDNIFIIYNNIKNMLLSNKIFKEQINCNLNSIYDILNEFSDLCEQYLLEVLKNKFDLTKKFIEYYSLMTEDEYYKGWKKILYYDITNK